MPGRNGTGPSGQGPMTGRGMGKCSAGNAANSVNAGNNGQSQSVGNKSIFCRGRGMGNGAGRGMGQGMNSGSEFGRRGR